MRLKIFWSFVFLFWIIFSLAWANSQDNEYIIGDSLKLDLKSFGENPAIKLITPEGSYLQKATGNYFVYVFESAGDYHIEINGDKKESYDITVKEKKVEKETEEVEDYSEYENYVPLENFTVEEVNESEFISFRDQKLVQNERIKVGEDVYWVEKKFITERKSLDIKIPEVAEEVEINGSEKVYFEIKESRFKVFSKSKDKSLLINDVQGPIEIKYKTPAPTKTEEVFSEDNKIVTIGSQGELGYKNVLAGTEVVEKIPIGREGLINVHWINGDRRVAIEAYDKDENGLIDYI